MIEKGADVNSKNIFDKKKPFEKAFRKGTTPLIEASKNGFKEICHLLIEKGANVNTKKKKICGMLGFDYTAVNYALQYCYKEIAKLLIENEYDINDEDAYSAFLFASEMGYIDICILMIQKGININKITYGLSIASENGRKEICELLIQNGVDVNKFEYDYTPLMMASKNGHKEICELLIANGADVNSVSTHLDHYIDYTPLMFAIQGGHLEVCRLLIKNGANLYASTDYLEWAHNIVYHFGSRKYTPFKLSIVFGHKDICELLIDSGINVKRFGLYHLVLYKMNWNDLYKKVIWNYRKHMLAIYN